MPTYEYQCQKCNEKFEAYQPLNTSDESVKCPKCGANNPKRQASVYTPRSDVDYSSIRYG